MLRVDCTELSSDEKLALASEISDSLEGKALALVNMDSIVLDELTDEHIPLERLESIVKGFVSRRKDGEHYSIELDGDAIVVHSADPVAASHRKRENTLPPNIMQCPYCSYVTQYREEYTVHTRAHLFGV